MQTQAGILQATGINVPVNSWFDHYLVGYVWHQPQFTVAQLISGGHPSAIHYFLGNALLNSILPAIVILCIISYFYPRQVFLKRRKKAL